MDTSHLDGSHGTSKKGHVGPNYALYLGPAGLLPVAHFGPAGPKLDADRNIRDSPRATVFPPPRLVSYPDPDFHSIGGITSPLRDTFHVAVM